MMVAVLAGALGLVLGFVGGFLYTVDLHVRMELAKQHRAEEARKLHICKQLTGKDDDEQ